MGMFDEVSLSIDCPRCGKKIPPWTFQTKDCQCNLERIDFRYANEFYGKCPCCGVWLTFHRRDPRGSLDDYRMFVGTEEAAPDEPPWGAPDLRDEKEEP